MILALGIVAAGSIPACGEETQTLEARELITELNEAGAGLRLGGRLPAQESGAEVWRVILPSAPRAPAQGAAPGLNREPSAALIVEQGEEAALSRYRSCQRTPALVCYRAVNVVLYINTDAGPVVQLRVRRGFLALKRDAADD
jgi:hypothetical protein